MYSLSVVELTILDWIAAHCHTAWLDVIMSWITRLGDGGFIWVCFSVALFVQSRKGRPYGFQMALALAFSFILCNLLLKTTVGRVRPFQLNELVDLLVPAPTDASFPSGHSSASFAAAAVLLLTKHPLRWVALVLACLIAFSRLYLYVHFPTDVLAGVLLGVLCGWLAVMVWRKLIQPKLTQRTNEK